MKLARHARSASGLKALGASPCAPLPSASVQGSLRERAGRDRRRRRRGSGADGPHWLGAGARFSSIRPSCSPTRVPDAPYIASHQSQAALPRPEPLGLSFEFAICRRIPVWRTFRRFFTCGQRLWAAPHWASEHWQFRGIIENTIQRCASTCSRVEDAQPFGQADALRASPSGTRLTSNVDRNRSAVARSRPLVPVERLPFRFLMARSR